MLPGNWWNMDNLKEDDRWSNLGLFLKKIYTILRKGITFQDNFRGSILSVTFDAADTNKSIEHGLSYSPTGYLVLSCSVSMNLYNGNSTFDKKFIYLKSDTIGTATILIF